MKKRPIATPVFERLFTDTGNEKYTALQSFLIIFLSSLMLAYGVYKFFSRYFSAAELISVNANVESPLCLALLLVFLFAVFTVILAFDKKRASVLMHHAFSLCMACWFFIGSAAYEWPEYENPLYIVSACLLLAFYAGYLLEKTYPAVKKYGEALVPRAALIAAAACGLYFIYFSWLGLERHALYYTQMYDMAWENQALYNLSHSGAPYSTVESVTGAVNWGDHASLIYYLLAPFYLLFPRPEFLIVLQAAAVSAAGFLVFLLAGSLLKSQKAGLLLGFVFLLHPSVQGWLLQDFHVNTLAVPLFFGFLIFTERKNFIVSLGFFTAMALVREDLAFFSFFAGLYVMSQNRGTGPVKGLVFPLAGLVIAALMLLLMRSSGGGPADMKRFYSMSPDFTGVLSQMALNPFYVFSQLFETDKLSFIAVVSAPLLFMFYRQPAAWIMLVPAGIFGVLSKYQPHYLPGYHYSVLFACAAFAGFIYHFREQKKTITPFIAGAMITLALLFGYFYGNMFSKSLRLVYTEPQLALSKPDYVLKGWQGLYAGLRGTKDPGAEKIADMIPQKFSVAADYFFASHVSGRRRLYQLSAFKEADVIITRKPDPAYADYTILKETKRWVFYVRSEILRMQEAGVNADGSVFFKTIKN